MSKLSVVDRLKGTKLGSCDIPGAWARFMGHYDVDVSRHQTLNKKNWQILTDRSITKIPLPPVLQLQLPDKSYYPPQLTILHLCKVVDVNGDWHTLAFMFNLMTLVREIIVATCYAQRLTTKTKTCVYPIVVNPVTQLLYSEMELLTLHNAFVEGFTNLNTTFQERLASKLSSVGTIAGYSAYAATFFLTQEWTDILNQASNAFFFVAVAANLIDNLFLRKRKVTRQDLQAVMQQLGVFTSLPSQTACVVLGYTLIEATWKKLTTTTTQFAFDLKYAQEAKKISRARIRLLPVKPNSLYERRTLSRLRNFCGELDATCPINL